MDIKENIISMVRENPPIFDVRHPLYKDRTCQFDTWHSIGQQVGLTGVTSIPFDNAEEETVQTEFIIEEDSVILETPTSSDPDLTTTRPHKRRRRPEKNGNSEALAAMLNMLQQNNQAIADAMGANKANTDEFTAFGVIVAEGLRKMEAARSKATMRSISMMIFNDE